MERVKVSKDFYADEYFCKCGRLICDAVPPTKALINMVQDLRDELGIPLTITSGSRCVFWNTKQKGKPHSEHLTGNAADIEADYGLLRYRILAAAIKLGVKGIGVNNAFIHVDTRQSRVAFGY